MQCKLQNDISFLTSENLNVLQTIYTVCSTTIQTPTVKILKKKFKPPELKKLCIFKNVEYRYLGLNNIDKPFFLHHLM